MPQCSRLESFSWATQDAGLRFVAVPDRKAAMAVDFAAVLQRLLPNWAIATLDDGRIKGDARIETGALRLGAETTLHLLETGVTIEDSADASHALRIHKAWDVDVGDFAHSDVGKLVRRAKSYDQDRNSGDRHVATQLAEQMLSWIKTMQPYANADIIVPAPSTNPNKDYDLPKFIARYLAQRMSRGMVPIQSSNTTPQKDLSVADKASADDLAQHYTVTGSVRDKVALVIDDIYGSGATVGAVTQVLRRAEAKAVLSLTATKAARGCQGLAPNTDNWPIEAQP